MNRNAPRFLADINVFHSREERVATAAVTDAEILQAAGYNVRWLRREPAIHAASIVIPAGATHDATFDSTQLEWIVDSDLRFFPVLSDLIFGYVLHPIDLATNKVMAAAGRRALRDIVDLVTVHQFILPLGAVIWAAVEKAPGFTPEGLVAEIRRNSLYPAAEWRSLITTEPLNPNEVTAKLRTALNEAEAFIARMPTSQIGLLFLEEGKPVQLDPDHLQRYQTHAGRLRGH